MFVVLRSILFTTLVLLLCAACSSLPEVEKPLTPPDVPEPTVSDTLEGTWLGTMVFEDYTAKLELSLEQNLVFVRGSGTLNINLPLYKASVPGTISGMVKYGEVHFQLTPDNTEYCYYSAKAPYDSETLDGEFRGVNCVDETIQGTFLLQKQ